MVRNIFAGRHAAWCAGDLEHFQEKWTPVFRPKMRQNKELEPHSDSIGMEKALGWIDEREPP
jgi:hypothetical protein